MADTHGEQIIYKGDKPYYLKQKALLLKQGYAMKTDADDYTVFEQSPAEATVT